MSKNLIDFNEVKSKKVINNNNNLVKTEEYFDELIHYFNTGKERFKTINTSSGFFNNYNIKLFKAIEKLYTLKNESIDDFLDEYNEIAQYQLIKYLKDEIGIEGVVLNFNNKRFIFNIYYEDVLICNIIYPQKVSNFFVDKKMEKHQSSIIKMNKLLETKKFRLKKLTESKLKKIINRKEIVATRTQIKTLKTNLEREKIEFSELQSKLNSMGFNLLIKKLETFVIKHSIKVKE